MKTLFTILVILHAVRVFAQCEERNNAGSVSMHFSVSTQVGIGGELGTQGLLDNFSGFLGIDITSLKRYEGRDSSVSLVYTKALYRFYENEEENLDLAGVLAPAFVNTDFEFLTGLRLLYVTGKNTAISIEPLWYVERKQFHMNINIHFLL